MKKSEFTTEIKSKYITAANYFLDLKPKTIKINKHYIMLEWRKECPTNKINHQLLYIYLKISFSRKYGIELDHAGLNFEYEKFSEMCGGQGFEIKYISINDFKEIRKLIEDNFR